VGWWGGVCCGGVVGFCVWGGGGGGGGASFLQIKASTLQVKKTVSTPRILSKIMEHLEQNVLFLPIIIII